MTAMIRWAVFTISCLLVACPPAHAEWGFRESFSPYNLVCDVSGEYGSRRYILHVEDVQSKLIFNPTINIGSNELAVEVFDSNTVRARVAGDLSKMHDGVVVTTLVIDRNTGAIQLDYRMPEQRTADKLAFQLFFSDRGQCVKREQAF